MLGKLLGREKTPERFPQENFTIGQGERDGRPAFVMLNLAYRDYAFPSDYPWHLQIEIAFDDANEHGLCTDDEAQVLNAMEDRLDAALRETGGVHYIARQTWNGLRMIDYYVENGEAAERALEALATAGQLDRSFTFEVKRDEDWAICLSFFDNF
ncbi:MAG: DUF695 domain-containing protein [Dehalococcoidia bacterium]